MGIVHPCIYTMVHTRVYTTRYMPPLPYYPGYTTVLPSELRTVSAVQGVMPERVEEALGSNLEIIRGIRRIEAFLLPKV